MVARAERVKLAPREGFGIGRSGRQDGLEAARASRFWQERRSLLAAGVTVAVDLARGMLIAGFIAGWVACAALGRRGGRDDQGGRWRR